MATPTDTRIAPSAHPSAAIATELRALEKRASEYETAVRRAAAGLHVLDASELLDHIPMTTEQHRRDFDAFLHLVAMIEGELARVEEDGKIALGDRLGMMASRLEREGGTNGRPVKPALSYEHNIFTDQRVSLGIANLQSSYRTNGGEVRSADSGATHRLRGSAELLPGAPV